MPMVPFTLEKHSHIYTLKKLCNAKCLALGFILCVFSLQVSAQRLKKGFDKISEKDYIEAKKFFSDAIRRKKEPLAAKYGMGLLLGDSLNTRSNYGSAHRNLDYVKKNWNKLTPDQISEYQENYSLSLTKVIEVDSIVQIRAYLELQQDPNPTKRATFMRTFGDASAYKNLEKSIAKAKFELICHTSSPEDLDAFINQYPNSDLRDSAETLSENLWIKRYENYSFDGELNSLLMFDQTFPDHAVPSTLIDMDKNIAEFAQSLRISQGIAPNKIDAYKKYIQIAGKKTTLAFVVLQQLVEPAIEAENWELAINIVKQNKVHFGTKQEKLDNLIYLLQGKSYDVKKELLNAKVNSAQNEYIPVISADNSHLYFCGFKREGGIGQEDVFVSEWKQNDWETPQAINELDTEDGYEAPLSISTDGNTLIFFKNRHIYFSKRNEKGWSPPQKYPEPINGNDWQGEAQMTSDGKALLFVSDRPEKQGLDYKANSTYHGGNAGNIDIYISLKGANNQWEKPINLGKTVNTPFCERGIFLHPDMKTLYFSSDGHGGFGGLDIYKTTRLSDTSWTQWSKPQNLGKSINTTDDDWGYKITTEGTHAYYAAQNEGQYDLLKMDLPAEIRPEYIATISGRLLDMNDNPVHAVIKWENLSTGKSIGEAESNPKDGAYFLVVPLGKNYGYFIEKDSYFPTSSNIDLRNQKTSINVQHDIHLISIKEMRSGNSIRLNNLFFDTGKFALKTESFPELDRVAILIQNNANLLFNITGHTDNDGNETQNKTLSENRARSVCKYLIEKGCNPDHLKAIGLGASSPLMSNDTEIGKAQNRRVEISIAN